MKPCRIADYCYGNKQLNFAVDPTENGSTADCIWSRFI